MSRPSLACLDGYDDASKQLRLVGSAEGGGYQFRVKMVFFFSLFFPRLTVCAGERGDCWKRVAASYRRGRKRLQVHFAPPLFRLRHCGLFSISIQVLINGFNQAA